ncbi:butyrate kinase [Streptococcus moroccensis]|uniref:Probable butyrate kinase n=1 Tax=Streptococcus moroccensis TaxID=1451356 RepID=A0ABT9YRJ7_9STRE|nr:butyrate kinase [Streptococcus moroccensis]MDQ0222349.1 butyrate kinase [Streptococcus moroccensis]
MNEYRVLTINPGSTSTKIAYFVGKECLLSENVAHQSDELATFSHISEQFSYRKKVIEDFLQQQAINATMFDAVVGRGGGLLAVEGGVYKIDDCLLTDAKNCANGVEHPACLGPQLAAYFAEQSSCSAYVVNPPDTDEYQDLARLTGIKGHYRTSHLHALNLKETALHHAQLMGEAYRNKNYIVCHIGGGISVSAHRKGRMVDGIDIVGGEGPFAPTRSGSLGLSTVIELIQEGCTSEDLKKFCTQTGGLVSLLGTSDAREISEQANQGDEPSKLVWDTMLYQISKTIGQMATVLKGNVSAILLSGGMVYNENLVLQIKDYCEWIAPIVAYPGEFEMEAMANGALRVLSCKEELKYYKGVPIWQPSDFPL